MNDNYTAILKGYAHWFDTLGYNAKTKKRYTGIITQFFDYLHTQDVSQITQLNQEHLKTYFDYVQTIKSRKTGEAYSIIHLNDIFFAVDKLCEFLHDMGIKNAPAPINYRIKHEQQQENIDKIEPFTIEEIKQLQKAIPDTYPKYNFTLREQRHKQLELIFALCYGCALRRMEAYKLTTDDVDFDRKTIFIKQGKNYKDRDQVY
jgi:integrase/recombinase XerD